MSDKEISPCDYCITDREKCLELLLADKVRFCWEVKLLLKNELEKKHDENELKKQPVNKEI